MSETNLPDYYEVLQLSPRADQETIERVFRHLAKRFHPDNRETGNTERFAELVEAYRLLADPSERARYDVSYEGVREGRWRLFGQDSVNSEIAADNRIRIAILSILFVARRNNPSEPGVGSVELERVVGCPEPVIRFHLWYLRENGWITRLDMGALAITATGVDRVFELGGPGQVGQPLLRPGEAFTPAGPAPRHTPPLPAVPVS
jgi:hypothetical protein